MVLIFLTSLFGPACSQKGLLLDPTGLSRQYFYEVDLNTLRKDRLSVRLTLFGVRAEELVFNFPRTVPGIYGAVDFGKYITDFHAMAGKEELPVERLSVNSWRIGNAAGLTEIRYDVDDGWEDYASPGSNQYYLSAESSFTANRVFVINNNCLFGYFSGGEEWPVYVSFTKPEDLFAATSLPNRSAQPDKDEFLAKNYRELVDHPILFAKPDTAWLDIGNTKVLVACYTDTGYRLAERVATHIRTLLENQRAYMGDTLPVDRYSFLIYYSVNERTDQSFGEGLEHNTSTLCLFNAAWQADLLEHYIYNLASHEFFHVLTPLNVHSEEIGRYDFLTPKMSQHLWMYEGMTEYATMHMKVWQGLGSAKEFLDEVESKWWDMGRFDAGLSLTDLSRQAMEKQDQYYNVYLKGALVCMCLDIRLREWSKGKYGTRDLMRDLAARYGKDRAFQDDALFEVIASMTFPDIRRFFSDYVEGVKPLPLKEYLERAGIEVRNGGRNLRLSKSATPEQLQLRKWWLGQE
ncbi:MAG: peptidase M61 [Lewinellaceae bacterium]|nr:peptidase M61 [Lewinellaceae bacterium]